MNNFLDSTKKSNYSRRGKKTTHKMEYKIILWNRRNKERSLLYLLLGNFLVFLNEKLKMNEINNKMRF